jgi:hypothetical protein
MITPLFKKLNLKDQQELWVVNAPASFDPELAALTDRVIHRDPCPSTPIAFALAFVTQQQQVDQWATTLVALLEDDGILWLAYPKASSKTYRCEFNRDTGWAVLGDLGLEPVRQVAIDQDWSALRFRRVDFIKTLTRDPKRAITAEGQSRTSRSGE